MQGGRSCTPSRAASLPPRGLCLPQLTTEPGRLILGALTDYGGYIVDDTGSQQGGGALCMEHAVNAEMLQAYGYSVAIEDPLTSSQVRLCNAKPQAGGGECLGRSRVHWKACLSREPRPLGAMLQGAPLYWDIVRIFQARQERGETGLHSQLMLLDLLLPQALAVVANNGPENVGGGGTPRRPAPPPICGV